MHEAAQHEVVVLPLGVGDAFSQKYYATSFLIGKREDGRMRWLLVDCPHPIRKMLFEASQKSGFNVDIEDIEGVVLTHLHADHVSGLEDFAYFSLFALKKRVQLFVHPRVQKRLWEGCLAAGMEHLTPPKNLDSTSVDQKEHLKTHGNMVLEDYFEIHSLSTTAGISAGPFVVESRFTAHHIPTTALRFSLASKPIVEPVVEPGVEPTVEPVTGLESELQRCFAHSADASFDLSLIDWLARSPLFFHETNWGTHTPLERLESLSEDVKEKMRLVHYPDSMRVDESRIQCALEGKAIRLHFSKKAGWNPASNRGS